MSPADATPKPVHNEEPFAWAEALAALDLFDIRMHMAEEAAVAGEEDDDDDEDEDDDLPVDEEGYERTPVREPVTAGRLDTSNRVSDTDAETHAAPDVSSDRVSATDAEPEGSLDRVKSAPLGIQQIEDLEDDAKGG